VTQILLSHSQTGIPEVPHLQQPTNILDEPALKLIWSMVPLRNKIRSLQLSFNSRTMGHALSRLYLACENGPLLMVVQTMKGDQFGAYLSNSWGGKEAKNLFWQW